MDGSDVRTDHRTLAAPGEPTCQTGVVFDYGDASYSWDRLRLAKIEYKQTLSDCAVDGTIPEAVRISKADLQRQGRAALEKFLARVRLEGMLVDLQKHLVNSEDVEAD